MNYCKMHLPLLPLSLLALLPTLASSVIVYQTSTLTVAAAAATSYVTAASSLAPSAAPSSTPSSTTSSSPAAAAPSSSNSQYTSDTTFESSILNSTNTYRNLYNATSLTWNTTLASYASTYADKCIFAHSHGPYGENIAETYPNVTATVEGWGGEGKKYNWGHPGFGEGTGHFTQLVWKGTTSVG
ncbi:hypothetical protein OEA41_004286 [Lepraria neglecta]|uniref:SCP domain-containing protein n=1 Tax=Lepraria neglecta TaxID=209136 RepID=A0AAD9YXK2_9LECA|nr:hypothetical protein OEA41_004286 [Lepraria neglecta]